MVKTECLQTFVAIVAAGSLSGAARRSGLSKSVVSQRLAELEQTLGVRLLHRSTRQLRLTEEGAAFHDLAERIVSELAEAATAIAARAQSLQGPIRLAMPTSFAILHGGPALYPFLGAHPGIRLSLDLDDRVIDLVGAGIDMAVRIGRLDDSGLIARRLTTSRRLVVLSPAYAAAHGLPRRLDELAAHPAITYGNRRVSDGWTFETAAGPRTVRVQSRLHVNNGDVMRDAAIAGLGIAMLPSFLCAEALAAGTLVRAPLEGNPAAEGVYAVYPQNRHLSAKVRALTEHLRAAFGDPPYWDHEQT
ncbi:MAG: LysR family transcriptional regulator [Rhodospirillales bacterium]|nr:LysR family transcriptional regulator [Rhodospirillales bacterium]